MLTINVKTTNISALEVTEYVFQAAVPKVWRDRNANNRSRHKGKDRSANLHDMFSSLYNFKCYLPLAAWFHPMAPE